MYSALINKWFILSKMQITNFLIGKLVALFHLYLFQKRSPAFVLLLCSSLQSTCNHYMVIKRYTNEVSGHSFIQNLSSVLTKSTLKWKGEWNECLPLGSTFIVDLENLENTVYLLTINKNGICQPCFPNHELKEDLNIKGESEYFMFLDFVMIILLKFNSMETIEKTD